MNTDFNQDAGEWPEINQDSDSCSMGSPSEQRAEYSDMKKKTPRAAKKASLSNSEPAKNVVITAHDVEIMTAIGRGKLTTSTIYTSLLHADKEAALGNMLNKLTKMADKGFITDHHKDDSYRVGLREGEQRRYWQVTPLGREACALHARIISRLNDPDESKTQSRRFASVTPIRKKKKKAAAKKVAAKKVVSKKASGKKVAAKTATAKKSKKSKKATTTRKPKRVATS